MKAAALQEISRIRPGRKERPTTVLLHILIWTALMLLPYLAGSADSGYRIGVLPGWFFNISGVMHAVLFYGNAYVVSPLLLNRRWWWLFIVVTALLVAGGIQLKLQLLTMLLPEALQDSATLSFVIAPTVVAVLMSQVYRAVLEKSQVENEQISPVLPDKSQSFFVNSEYALVRITVDDILYIEGMKDYVKIHISNAERPVITRMTLKFAQEKLPSHAFAQTHKSFVVALSKITAVKRDFVCIEKSQIPLSQSYRDDVMRFVHQSTR